MTEACSHP